MGDTAPPEQQGDSLPHGLNGAGTFLCKCKAVWNRRGARAGTDLSRFILCPQPPLPPGSAYESPQGLSHPAGTRRPLWWQQQRL